MNFQWWRALYLEYAGTLALVGSQGLIAAEPVTCGGNFWRLAVNERDMRGPQEIELV